VKKNFKALMIDAYYKAVKQLEAEGLPLYGYRKEALKAKAWKWNGTRWVKVNLK
jgi:hypothetical protein